MGGGQTNEEDIAAVTDVARAYYAHRPQDVVRTFLGISADGMTSAEPERVGEGAARRSSVDSRSSAGSCGRRQVRMFCRDDRRYCKFWSGMIG